MGLVGGDPGGAAAMTFMTEAQDTFGGTWLVVPGYGPWPERRRSRSRHGRRMKLTRQARRRLRRSPWPAGFYKVVGLDAESEAGEALLQLWP